MSTIKAPSSIELVASKLSELRLRYSLARLFIESARILVVALATWCVMAMADHFLELSTAWRRVGICLSLAFVGWFAFRRLRLVRAESSPYHVASLLESTFDGFGQRLRTILDTIGGRVTAPEEMVHALGNQALGRWDTVTPKQVIPTRKVGVSAFALCLAMVSLVAFLANDHWRLSFLRAVGIDAPYSTLTVVPGNTTILEGEDVELSLSVSGRQVPNATLRYRFLDSSESEAESAAGDASSTAWIEVDVANANFESSGEADSSLDQDSNAEGIEVRKSEQGSRGSRSLFSLETPATFPTWLRKLGKSIEYQFASSVGDSRTYRVDVRPLVDVTKFEMRVSAPAYTGADVRVFSQPKINVLENSNILASIETSQPLREARLLVGPKPQQLQPVDVLQSDQSKNVWSFTLPSTASLHWQFEGVSVDDVPVSPFKGRLRVRSDGPPKLKWRSPGMETKVSTLTEVRLDVDVTDDYGLSESGIVFQLGDEEEFVLAEWTGQRTTGEPATRSLRLSEVLPLESFGLGQFDYISYYAYAVDNRDGGPLRTESDLRFIDIRPLRQYFRRSEFGGEGGGGGGFRTSVDEIIRRQRNVINQTRKLLRSSSSSMDIAQQLGTVDSVVATQSELAGFVRFLIDRLTERGFDDNLDALAAAESSMLLAADSLAVGELSLAQSQQREAMRALVEANDELENLLADLSSRQMQSLRGLTRQLEQMLQLAPEESDQQLASALRGMARQQSKLGGESEELQQSFRRPPGNQLEAADPSATTIDQEQLEAARERLDQLIQKQIQLQERLLEISELVSEQVAASELVVERFRENMDRMDKQISAAQNESLDEFSRDSESTAASLEELALLIESIAPRDATDRIAALRDLVASLSQLESDRSDSLRAMEDAGERGESSMSNTEQSGTDAEAAENRSGNDLDEQDDAIRERLATLSEALGAMENLQDGGEGAERLRQLLESTDLLEMISNAQAIVRSDEASEFSLDEQASNAMQRADDFRYAAIELENLYRELVAPQLEKLREMERLATEIQKSVEQTGSPTSEDVAAMQQLASDLRSMGMKGVADALQNPADINAEGLQGIADVLRARIQELMFLDTGADEQSAVPPRYEELINLYFRALSGSGSDL